MLLKALGILIFISLLPVVLKAFWYFLVAPCAARRPPIRLQPWANAVKPSPPSQREKLSAVSQAITVADGEELLVHPDYLQSSADRGRKDTKWLLHWRYPLTSLAAGMIGLTRIRSTTPEVFVVSSRKNPLAEIGLIAVPEQAAMVLQPRHLVGLVQRIDRPLRIHRRWVFGLSALITLQFRYLVFEGPGTLLVQGCRGVRLEPAGTGRSVDQKATMGFSAHLAYAPTRSETFGAYLMGASGLFNDRFVGDTGFFVYEEMPNAGRRAGITGRGLEGLTDAVLRVLGV